MYNRVERQKNDDKMRGDFIRYIYECGCLSPPNNKGKVCRKHNKPIAINIKGNKRFKTDTIGREPLYNAIQLKVNRELIQSNYESISSAEYTNLISKVYQKLIDKLSELSIDELLDKH